MQWLVIIALINKRVVSLVQTVCVLALMVLFDLGYLMQIYQEDSEDSYLQQDVTGDFIYYFAGKLVIDAVIGFDLYCSYYRSRMN